MEFDKAKLNSLQKFNLFLGFIIVILMVIMMNSQLLFSQNLQEIGLTFADGGLYTNEISDSKSGLININSSQVLSFNLPKESKVILSLYDRNENLVKLLIYDYMPAGKHEYSLVNQIPAGNYKCRFSAGDLNESIEFIIQ